MRGPLGAPGPLGALEEAADVQKAFQLLKTVDLVAADAGARGCLTARWGGPLLCEAAGGPRPRVCELEGFKELQRQQRRQELQRQQQEPQQQLQQQLLLEAETAVAFVSSFVEEALPSLEALVHLLPSLRHLTLCCFFSVSLHFSLRDFSG